jgi:uncharacterized protein (TIGR03067 family)
MRARLLPALAALAALAAAGFAPVPPAKPVKDKLLLKKLQGAWKVEKFETGTPGAVAVKYVRVEIKGDTWTSDRADGPPEDRFVCLLKLDAKGHPPKVDLWLPGAKANRPRWAFGWGVIELEGNRLTMTYALSAADERPTKASGPLSPGQLRWVLKRAKP